MRLRYVPKAKKFETGAEYQWEMILAPIKTFWGTLQYPGKGKGFHREDGPARVQGPIGEFFIGDIFIAGNQTMTYLLHERKTATYFQNERKRVRR